MTDLTPSSIPPAPTWRMPSIPEPDTPEGRVLVYALVVSIAYILFLVVDNTALADQSGSFIQLPLILGAIASFTLGVLLGADYARARHFELELARTVGVHSDSGQLPEEDSPLGRVLKEYARTAVEHRRYARSHAYAVGPAIWGSLCALAATISWGFSVGSGAIWLAYLALVFEIPAFALLVLSVSILGTAVGLYRQVSGFDGLTPRRWRRFAEKVPAVEEALHTCPWLEEFVAELR